MSIFKSYEPTGSVEFPFPEREEDFREEELAVGDRKQAKVNGKWTLTDIRANSGIGDQNKTVVNLVAEGEYDGETQRGEVAYWLAPAHVANERHPARTTAAMLAQLMVALGVLSEEQVADVDDAADFLALLAQGAAKKTPKATFDAALVWEKRAYEGRDGEIRQTPVAPEFRWIKNVEVVTPF